MILTFWYQEFKQQLPDQPPSFDLFIALTFFDLEDSSPWVIVTEDETRPVEWQLDHTQFERLDTVTLALTNISGEKFYYTSWGAPFTRLRQDWIIYKNGLADTIPFGGFGCGTGVYIAPLRPNETMTSTIFNPLMFNLCTNYNLDIESDSFPDQFKSIYGDSIALRFSQATHSNPWNKYKSQMIFSEYITVSTEIVLDNWRQGDFARLPETEPTLEEHFGLKKIPQH